MENRSLVKNAIFNTLKNLASIVIPMIIFPYISRILSVESIGKWNYANSIVSYFLLFAMFGINEYATRTGSRIRDDGRQFKIFVNQIFTLNLIFSTISFVILLLLIFTIDVFSSYKIIILLLSINILIIPLSIDWLYNIFEDFEYVSIRSIIIQIISTILILLFVRSSKDIYIYILISILATTISILVNFFHARKYVIPRITFNVQITKHINNLFVFFINSLSSTIYLNSDVLLIGIMCNDHVVGLYSAATKIYYIVKQIFNSILLTMIPRLSYYAVRNNKSFLELLKKIVSIALVIVLPSSIGIFLMRKDIILIIAGSKYIHASIALGILAFAVFFAIFANIFVNGVMISRGMEKYVVKVTIFSAFLNVFLNFYFIPKYGQNGAALTTLIAEFVLLVFNVFYSRDLLNKILDKNIFFDSFIGTLLICIGYIILTKLINNLNINYILGCLVKVCICIFIYFLFLIFRKNSVVFECAALVKQKFMSKR